MKSLFLIFALGTVVDCHFIKNFSFERPSNAGKENSAVSDHFTDKRQHWSKNLAPGGKRQHWSMFLKPGRRSVPSYSYKNVGKYQPQPYLNDKWEQMKLENELLMTLLREYLQVKVFYHAFICFCYSFLSLGMSP